jgi:isoquinoline 1-oxidoreductase subunit alpha
MTHFVLDVNGRERTIDAEPEMPLLWALRDLLSMTGTKYGCSRKVTTIEGLSSDGSHPVQRAWITEQVPQCGYCQSGQIMQAAALIMKTPHPTREQINQAMTGNICRCATYQRIRRAIERAAQESA